MSNWAVKAPMMAMPHSSDKKISFRVLTGIGA